MNRLPSNPRYRPRDEHGLWSQIGIQEFRLGAGTTVEVRTGIDSVLIDDYVCPSVCIAGAEPDAAERARLEEVRAGRDYQWRLSGNR